MYVAPGATFEAFVDGLPSGLAGTLGVRILDNAGGTHTARVTAGISEFPAGAGRYEKSNLVAPTVAGDYTLYWDDGGTRNVSEPLVVTSSALVPSVPLASDLTSLAAVKASPGMRIVGVADDPELQRLISAYSRAIRHYTGREFAPKTPVSDADPALERRFSWDGEGSLSLEPFEARAVTTVTLYVDDKPGAVLVAADWRPGPRHKTDEGTYLWVQLRDLCQLTTPLSYPTPEFPPADIGISGRWGASSIPGDVEHACIISVANAYRNPEGFASRHLGEFDVVEVADVDVEGEPGALSLPKDARNLLGPYRRPNARRRFRSSTTA